MASTKTLSSSEKYTLFPIKYQSLWDFYKKHEGTFWTVEEVRLNDDIKDWNTKLNDNERFFIKNVLAFFAASDGIVNENLVVNFYNEIELPEARAFYTVQMMMETIHCVSGDTKILTDKGYYCIETLLGKQVDVWNGEQFSKVTVKYTGKQDLYRVTIDNGMYLDCTDGHKWLINGESERVETKYLKLDCELQEYKLPTLMFSGDHTNSNFDMGTVPLNNTLDYKLEWLQLYINRNFGLDGDYVKLPNLENLQLLFTTLEIFTRKIDNALYLHYSDLRSLEILGLKVKHKYFESMNTRNTMLKIQNVTKMQTNADTYCFNEPLNHTGIFNGILTGQSEQYSILIDTYIQDKDEKDRLFNAIETIPAIKKKSDWAVKWISNGQENVVCDSLRNKIRDFFIGEKCEYNDNMLQDFIDFTKSGVDEYSFEKRLLAFACVEGIFFSGSFCAIYWLKNRGIMPGLCTANQFISRDENLHTEFAIELYKIFGKRLSTETVHSIFKEAVEIEKEFITKSLPVSLLGMNCTLMSQYIEYVCDRWLVLLDYPKVYNSRNPFSFMEMISLETKENFFDGDTTEYSRAGITAETSEMEFGLDDDF